MMVVYCPSSSYQTDLPSHIYGLCILSEESITISRNAWCARDRVKAWDDWMLKGQQPPAAPPNCATPHEKVFALGQKLRITGTPTIFFADGTRVPGAIDAKALESKLASIK